MISLQAATRDGGAPSTKTSADYEMPPIDVRPIFHNNGFMIHLSSVFNIGSWGC
jgi:hypothetical protein